MIQQWQCIGVPSYNAAGQQHLLMGNNHTSAQRSPIPPSISSPLMLPEMYSVMSPPPMRYFSDQYYPNNQNMSSYRGYEATRNMGQVWPPVHNPPNSSATMIRAGNMTVEQTAEWVRTLGRNNMWEEADEYANNFAWNGITGYLLTKLTNKTLKEELGIAICGHRMEIMLAIKCLFPKNAPSEHFAEQNIMLNYELPSPMVVSSEETETVEDNASSIPTRSPLVSRNIVCSQRNGDLEAIEHSSSRNATPAAKKATPAVCPSLRRDPACKSNSWNSARARPSNPLVYKTLRKVKLRKGKGVQTKVIGYLPRGSIVVINQIKGRSGRIVFQDKRGRYKTAGWVTLYTKENDQLVRRYNPQTKDRGSPLSSFVSVIVE